MSMFGANNLGKIKICILFVFLFLPTSGLYAQISKSVECGAVIETELTSNNAQNRDTYLLNLAAGDSISIVVSPIGNSLAPEMFLHDPSFASVAHAGGFRGNTVQISNFVVSSTGSYTLLMTGNQSYKSIGAYVISFGCTLRDGTVIEPGVPATEPPTGNNPSISTSAPIFSGTGFPGLAPVDFEPFNFPRLPVNTPFGGDITTDNNQVLGYKFEAAANDAIVLSLVRTGNLNLGLVVLSADNKVVFQASLVTSSELTTKFTVPTAGTYTIGVFRIDLLPPAAPEATAFQLTATLNP